MINDQLKSLYFHKIIGINQLTEYENCIDGPILMKCWESEYKSSEFKILFVGQECNGWIGHLSNNIEELMEKYSEFELSKTGNRSVFWQYVYWINSLLNPKTPEGNNFLWTNVSKFSTLEGKRLEWNIQQKCISKLNCLQQEIEILNPEVVFFMSGPYYDDPIRLQFTGELTFHSVISSIPTRELARLEHVKLPFHCYRIYHPGALQRLGKYKQVEHVVQQILQSPRYL